MNPAIEAVGASVIRALHSKRRESSIDLGLGEPTLFPNVAHFERATRWVSEHGCRYSSNVGDPDLRAAIAAHYAYPSLSAAKNVCITTGSQEAVYVTLKTLLDPARDEVLVVEPVFNVYVKIAQVEGVRLRRVEIEPWAADPFDPDTILRASMKKIADGLLARGGAPVYVLHDEIYRELRYTEDFGSFGDVYPYTIAINSLSKSNALTGLRIGWVMAPADVMPEIVKMHGWATSCASTFAQRVAIEVFAANELATARAWYTEQRAGVLALVRETLLEYIEPDGAFYLCVRVGNKDMDTLRFAEALLEERDVVAIPGHIFAPSLSGWLRTSFVSPLADLREGLGRIAAFAAGRVS